MNLKGLLGLFKETVTSWSEDKAPRLAAALSYYTIFSLAPLLIVVIGIAGLALGQRAAEGEIAGQLRQLVGDTSARAIQDMIAHARKPSSGILATVIGVLVLLAGAGGVFGQLQDALNTVWGVKPKPGRGFLGMLKDRFLSFSMVLGVGFLLMVSLVLSAAVAAVGAYMRGMLPGLTIVWHGLDIVLSFGVIMLLLGMIYKVLPDAKVAWRDVWVGAAVTSLLFAIGKFALGMYLGRSSVASAYGAAGSLIVVLLWIYYSAQILFFGAEFTKVYARKYGSKIVPEEDAEPVTAEARAEQGMHAPPPERRGAPAPMPPAKQGMGGAAVALPAYRMHAPATERAAQVAGLVGAAVGLVIGLLRGKRG